MELFEFCEQTPGFELLLPISLEPGLTGPLESRTVFGVLKCRPLNDAERTWPSLEGLHSLGEYHVSIFFPMKMAKKMSSRPIQFRPETTCFRCFKALTAMAMSWPSSASPRCAVARCRCGLGRRNRRQSSRCGKCHPS